MFIGEGPGADEDAAGTALRGSRRSVAEQHDYRHGTEARTGLHREHREVPSAGNRTPERDECETCSPFLMRQIGVIRPKIIVALGATAAKNLLGMNDSMASLRGRLL